jgi:hypothetical protein
MRILDNIEILTDLRKISDAVSDIEQLDSDVNDVLDLIEQLIIKYKSLE